MTLQNQQVKTWFGPQFQALHPNLQHLHVNGGRLEGIVDIHYGTGLGGFIGRRLGKKLNIPGPGSHTLTVNIYHQADGLHWDRRFDDGQEMKSLFTPMGTHADGHMIEKTGPITLYLTVDIKEGGWHWRCLRYRIFNLPLPFFLFPKSVAYKTIENGQYRFYVGFSMPWLGRLLSYSGLLKSADT